MENRKSSVVIIDDMPIFRKGAADIIAATPDFQILGVTGDEKTALSLISLKPDIVLIDLDAEGFHPLELLETIKYRQPSCRAVMLLASPNSSSALMQAIRLDANGYLLRGTAIEEFLEQLRIVSLGGMATSEKVTSALAEHLRTGTLEDPESSVTQLLTKREFEVLCCIASGLSNREIADELQISDGTVKVHVKHLLKKLRFRSRVEAAVWASDRDYRLPDEKLKGRQK